MYRHVHSCNNIKYCRWRNVDISIKVCKAGILILRGIFLKYNPCRLYEVKTTCMWNKQVAVGVEFFCYPVLENCHSYYLHRKYFNFVTLGGSWGFETKEDTLSMCTMWNSLEDSVLDPGLGSCSKLLTQTWFSSSGLFLKRIHGCYWSIHIIFSLQTLFQFDFSKIVFCTSSGETSSFGSS